MVLWTVSAEEAKGLARSYSFSALAIWFSHCPITLSFFRTSLSPSLAQRKTHQQSASTRERATARRPMAKSIKARWGKGGRGNARALSCLPCKKENSKSEECECANFFFFQRKRKKKLTGTCRSPKARSWRASSFRSFRGSRAREREKGSGAERARAGGERERESER